MSHFSTRDLCCPRTTRTVSAAVSLRRVRPIITPSVACVVRGQQWDHRFSKLALVTEYAFRFARDGKGPGKE
mgnify:FL=1